MKPLEIAVVGHVEHITLGQVARLPGAGDIAHLERPICFPGGGGGVTFFQLLQSPATVHLFTAVGGDDAGKEVLQWLQATRARVHAARRDLPHTRDVVMVPPGGDRTIVVVGEPLHPLATDELPFELLARCDGVYFTAQDPALLRLARRARCLVVSARRREALLQAGVRADGVVGSAKDPREAATLGHFPVPPGALVMTEGEHGGFIDSPGRPRVRFAPPPPVPAVRCSYGAGDSFAGALTYFLAAGLEVAQAASRAGPFGAAVLGGMGPLAHQAHLPALP